MGSASRFRYECFYDDDYRYFAVNKSKYTRQQADEICEYELDVDLSTVKVSDGYVYHGFGMLDGEMENTYWLSDCPKGRWSIECYVYEMRY